MQVKQYQIFAKNMVGNITGMVCDGAKVGCALKVASGVSSSIQAAVLALDNICISSNDGIIEDCIEKTICNLGRIGAEGMQTTDKMILDIMVCKQNCQEKSHYNINTSVSMASRRCCLFRRVYKPGPVLQTDTFLVRISLTTLLRDMYPKKLLSFI